MYVICVVTQSNNWTMAFKARQGIFKKWKIIYYHPIIKCIYSNSNHPPEKKARYFIWLISIANALIVLELGLNTLSKVERAMCAVLVYNMAAGKRKTIEHAQSCKISGACNLFLM